MSSPALFCPPSPPSWPALRQDLQLQTMNDVWHGMPCWCYVERCEGVRFSFHLINEDTCHCVCPLTFLALPGHNMEIEIQICPNNVYRLDNMLSWLPSLILCHGESVSQDITEDYLSTCRYPPPRCPSVFIFPSLFLFLSLPVTDSRAVSQKILMTWPELSQLPQ